MYMEADGHEGTLTATTALLSCCGILQCLPGVGEHLTVVSGDITDAAALHKAMQQCQQLVHLAAIVDVRPPRDEAHKQQMIETALEGTRMVLGKCWVPGRSTLMPQAHQP